MFGYATAVRRVTAVAPRVLSACPPLDGMRSSTIQRCNVHTDSRRVSVDSFATTSDERRKRMLDEMLRVDHAGEVGAVKIYEGQAWALRGTPAASMIEDMRRGEVTHLETMTRLMQERRARPSALLPLAEAAGFALGAATALLGKEAAMACTVAVETVIGEHYNDQIRELLKAGYDEKEVADVFKRHRDEELAHLDTGLKNNAEQAPFYNMLSGVIQVGCRAAVWLVKRV